MSPFHTNARHAKYSQTKFAFLRSTVVTIDAKRFCVHCGKNALIVTHEEPFGRVNTHAGYRCDCELALQEMVECCARSYFKLPITKPKVKAYKIILAKVSPRAKRAMRGGRGFEADLELCSCDIEKLKQEVCQRRVGLTPSVEGFCKQVDRRISETADGLVEEILRKRDGFSKSLKGGYW